MSSHLEELLAEKPDNKEYQVRNGLIFWLAMVSTAMVMMGLFLVAKSTEQPKACYVEFKS